MIKKSLALILLSSFALSPSWAELWFAQPIEAHEWGVQVFDQVGKPVQADLPGFIHTPKDAPGKPVTTFHPPVREMPNDNGERLKPLVYFHLGDRENEAPVAASVGFAWGEPKAWYPQADHAKGFAAADPKDVRSWISRLGDDDFKVREEATRRLLACGGLVRPALEEALAVASNPEVKDRLGKCLEACAEPQLTWDHLQLTRQEPKSTALPGKDLRADHWVKLARQVDAAYVTNGTEAERFLFYEGRTSERPAVRVEALGSEKSLPEDQDKAYWKLTNLSRHPVHDVFLVSSRGGKRTLAFLDRLDPGKPAEIASTPEGDWKQAASGRLLARLQAGKPERKDRDARVEMRKPSESQGPTKESWLYPDEAEALLAIWGKDFFEGEGTRLVYREDPAALDEAMPLSIYTDMYHYIRLSRVGLVLVKGFPPPVSAPTTNSERTPPPAPQSWAERVAAAASIRELLGMEIPKGRTERDALLLLYEQARKLLHDKKAQDEFIQDLPYLDQGRLVRLWDVLWLTDALKAGGFKPYGEDFAPRMVNRLLDVIQSHPWETGTRHILVNLIWTDLGYLNGNQRALLRTILASDEDPEFRKKARELEAAPLTP